MPITGDGLFLAVKTALPVAQDLAMQEANLKPICTAIIDYIKANSVVTVTVTVPALGLISAAPSAPVTGVAAGSGTATIT